MGCRTLPPGFALQDSGSVLLLACSLPRKCTLKYAARFAAKVCALRDLIVGRLMLNPSAEQFALASSRPKASQACAQAQWLLVNRRWPLLLQPPNTTLCMMRPGTSVKRPAITSAPQNRPIIV